MVTLSFLPRQHCLSSCGDWATHEVRPFVLSSSLTIKGFFPASLWGFLVIGVSAFHGHSAAIN